MKQFSPGLIVFWLSFLVELSKRSIRAVMVLNNYWEWSGGMGQYVSWDQGTEIPYFVESGNFQVFVDYVNQFYSCDACQSAYRAHIQMVIGRVNTISGVTYRDDPTIFSWELANEPRGYPVSWIAETAAFIKSLDENHMVTTGSEGSWAEDFQSTHASEYINYTTCHIWVENWGMYNPNISDDQSLNNSVSFAVNYLGENARAAADLNKPLVLEEFGIARDGWTGPERTNMILRPQSPTGTLIILQFSMQCWVI